MPSLRVCWIMIDVIFFQEPLHINVVKFFSYICRFFRHLLLFWIILAIASHSLPSLFLSGMAHAYLFNTSMTVSIIFIETRIWVHLVSLPQIIISPYYDAPSRKISSCRSVQFLDEPTSLGANFFFFFDRISFSWFFFMIGAWYRKQRKFFSQ